MPSFLSAVKPTVPDFGGEALANSAFIHLSLLAVVQFLL